MANTWDFKQCVSVLNGEIELLRKISSTQTVVRKAVVKRKWMDFDSKNEEVMCLGAQFALLDDERQKLFSTLHGGKANNESAQTRFYTSIAALPSEERIELSRLYRELKMETLKMQALNESFLAYLNEANTLAASYLETVSSSRGGKLYTNKGRRVTQDLKSIVYNNHF